MKELDEVKGRKIDQEGNIFLFPPIGKVLFFLLCAFLMFVSFSWLAFNAEEILSGR